MRSQDQIMIEAQSKVISTLRNEATTLHDTIDELRKAVWAAQAQSMWYRAIERLCAEDDMIGGAWERFSMTLKLRLPDEAALLEYLKAPEDRRADCRPDND